MQLLSRRRSGPLSVREVPRVRLLENDKGGQQRLEDEIHWPRLLAAYSALTAKMKTVILASAKRMERMVC